MKDTVKLNDKKSTQIVAHRGYSFLERENTINAFVASSQRSVFGAECDIHLTKDGKYVVYHDNNTSRLCNDDIILEESTFEEIRALKLKDADSEEFCEFLKIPTLSEYLSIMKRYGKVGIIEVKNAMPYQNLAEVVDICKREYDLDKIIFISFWIENLENIRKIDKDVKLQFLCGEVDDHLMEKLASFNCGIDIAFPALNKQNVEKMHQMGIVINCFTCNDLEEGQKLVDLGVDFITSDILE